MEQARTHKIFRLTGMLSIVLIFLCLRVTSVWASESPAVNIMIDGKMLLFNSDSGVPYMENGRTMVPLRLPMETIGCCVSWDSEIKGTVIEKDNTKVTIVIGSNIMTVNDSIVELDTTAVIKNGRTYLPIRAVLEAFGCYVQWLNGLNTVDVYSSYTIGSDVDIAGHNGIGYIDIEGDTAIPYKGIIREWKDGRTTWTTEVWYSDKIYCYYRGLNHTILNLDSYQKFVIPVDGDTTVDGLVDSFRVAKPEWSDFEIVKAVFSYIQSLEYVTDESWTGNQYIDYPKYPYETLYDGCGDCEDFALLGAAVLKSMGYGCCLIRVPEHMALGVLMDDTFSGTYYELNGNKYFYVELTNPGWEIGVIPEEYKTVGADIIPIL